MRDASLHTVCEEAMCPNIGECWEEREATFLILGAKCTRRCGFCDVMTAKPDPVDEDEPRRLAEAVRAMGLRYVVLTGVARDDLPDGGAHVWAAAVRAIKRRGAGHRHRGAAVGLQGRRRMTSRPFWTPGPTCSRTTSRRSVVCTTASGPRSATTAPWTCCASRSATVRARSRSRTSSWGWASDRRRSRRR